MVVARSISGGRVNVVGLRLPEEEEEVLPETRLQAFKRKIAERRLLRAHGLEPSRGRRHHTCSRIVLNADAAANV